MINEIIKTNCCDEWCYNEIQLESCYNNHKWKYSEQLSKTLFIK